MNILITGGFGYLGSYCAELFYREGVNVTLLGRRIPDYMKIWSEKFETILGDITDINLIEKIKKRKFDCVVHFAAANENVCLNNSKQAITVNAFGTKNMLNICKEKGINKFIYISTFHVYGSQKNNTVINEKCCPNPINDYGITHYFGELYCKQYSKYSNINCVVLRPSNFYTGPLFNEINRWSLVPNNFIKQIVDNKKIIINSSGKQIRNFISILDLYNAIKLSFEDQISKFEIFNVGGEKNYSINEIADLTVEIYEKIFKNEEITILHTNKVVKENIIQYVYDISKVKLMGYKSINNVKQEIKKTIELYFNIDISVQ
ncbi:NAD-dependent epimerase/dehydratase family protein [Oceanirhabdus seepicola]|uniref:NAD(P)-dependent oxidoreductase n=1 Tax=Oceanirhabdus seepicola TaxID=2828781 RepID=A0A9J6NZ93_9CLOT|nr:NAD(P)-dependent oxidoreductase [Oceanirhabdus seepicola]MCM1989302.1 NAD(P)-dependent oxidoreductase [Oceanirhabdus seepicola]